MYKKYQLETWFRKKEGNELIFRKKYLVDGLFIGKYIAYLRFRDDFYRLFQLTTYYSHEFSDRHVFYEWIPQKAQENMERRAVNRILQTILNDPYFEW